MSVPPPPLAGLRVVVTRPQEKADNLMRLLQERGAEAIHYPTISIADPVSWDEVDKASAGLRDGRYDWIVFTSVNAVEKVAGRMQEPAEFTRARVAAVGSVTRAALEDLGIRVELVPDEFTGEALAEALGTGKGRILLPRVEGAPRSTVRAIEARGWRVDEVVAYRNLPIGDGQDLEDFDAVTFASGSTARNFTRLQDVAGLGLAPHTGSARSVVCIGSRTAEEARSAGMRVDVVAAVHTDEGMVTALEEHLTAHPSRSDRPSR